MRSRVLFRDSAGLTLFLIGAVAVSLPRAAHADDVTPPDVPHDLQVPVGNTAFLVGHADGTQNYVCLPSSSGFAWTLFTPQATLFDDQDKELITHFFSPNPSENGTIRATWQHSRDASTVWAAAINNPVFVTKGAVPWLLLQVPPNGTREGPTGGATLAGTTFIQRVNTHGGVAAPADCASSSDVGKKAFVPYTADYFFYKAASASDGQ
ncbi:hypothetical protein AMOR_14990 [Anaeromyxobacter oryzae]|uniref:DUF3455 domain-containing protein n=2 Tax=Anaeromyxobacter oryzae TaxID=2918170 RepID=A0ABN6MSU1_9BACT|nr:hypothetical protein AMOR_14990 [Anaeromyxobacter oryzae]